jgi:hypothetical protein
MGWVTLDDNFPTHPKTVQAGKDAAYLYVCGLCYCRKYHTEGFIPANAVRTLGASTTPRKLIDALIAAGFWRRAEGGFQVHDYAAIYPNDAGDKQRGEENRQKKRDAGRKGGLASWAMRKPKQTEALASAESKHAASSTASSSAEALYRGGVGSGTGVPILERGELRDDDPPMDAWFHEVWTNYPPNRRTRSARAQHCFVEQMHGYPEGPVAAWALFRANLELNIASHEWRVKGMAKGMEAYICDGLWLNHHPAEAPIAERASKSKEPAGLPPVYTEWVCPHLEPCPDRMRCHVNTTLQRPLRSEAS